MSILARIKDDLTIDRKDKRKVFFITHVADIPTVVKKRRIRETTEHVRFRELKFPFDINRPTFRLKSTFYYIVDVKSGQMFFEKSSSPISPELADTILSRNVVKQLVAGLQNMGISQILMYVLLTLGMGISLGYIIGNFVPMG